MQPQTRLALRSEGGDQLPLAVGEAVGVQFVIFGEAALEAVPRIVVQEGGYGPVDKAGQKKWSTNP